MLKKKLEASINQARSESGLKPLKISEPLNLAAEDQAVFNRKINKAETEQSSKKKATTARRVKYFNGLYHLVDEYGLGMNIQTRTTLKSSSRHKNPSTYTEAVDFYVTEWTTDKHNKDLIFSSAFFEMGMGFAFNDFENVLFITVVLGSEPYVEEVGFKYHKKSYKIRPYERNVCKNFERSFSYLSELFADNIRIQDGHIQFHYHDLNLIESFLQNGKDGLAVDIIKNSQYDCAHGNILHPSPIYSGMMLKPVWKNRLLKANPSKEQKEFVADLGLLPAGLDTNDITFNLLMIQSKCLCKKIAYNDLNGQNIRLLKIDLAVDTLSIAQSVDSNSKYLSFTIPFEKNKYEYEVEDIKPFLDSIELNRFNIKEVDILAYSSIEGNAKINHELQEKRAHSMLKAISEYQLQEVKTKVEARENWEGFMTSIKGSPYEKEFRGLTQEEIRTKVNFDTSGYDLEPYLADQRKAEIKIFVESIYIDSLTPKYLPEKLKRAIRDKDYIRCTALQTLMYKAVLAGELDQSVLFEGEIPQYKEFIALANNRLAFKLEFDETGNVDSIINDLRMEVEALLGVEEGNGHLKYNKQAIKLYYWAKDLSFLVIDEENKINQVKDFERDIRKLYNTKIHNYKVNRLLMNFNIIAADYYYEKQDFKNRVRALKQVKRFVQKAKLDRDQTYIMARYFIFQMQIEWAVYIMQPFIKEGDYDEDFLLTFLGIAVYDQRNVKQEAYYKYLDLAAEKYNDGFCKLFTKPGMSADFLNDLNVKSIYCENCN